MLLLDVVYSWKNIMSGYFSSFFCYFPVLAWCLKLDLMYLLTVPPHTDFCVLCMKQYWLLFEQPSERVGTSWYLGEEKIETNFTELFSYIWSLGLSLVFDVETLSIVFQILVIYSGCLRIAYVGWESGEPYWCEEHTCWDDYLLSSTGKLYVIKQKLSVSFSLSLVWEIEIVIIFVEVENLLNSICFE